jgi:hypothetical protein
VRLLAIALIAACGGSSAPPPAAVKPSTPAETEEDWRGVLSQWVGTWSFKVPKGELQQTCSWLGTFVACKTERWVTLLGYEPTNRRYVAWTVDDVGLHTFAGTAGATAWNLESGAAHLSWRRTSPTTWAEHTEVNGEVQDGVYTATTPPGPPPPAPPAAPASSVDWRGELQSLVGTWTFTGTFDGQPLTYTETCDWVPASTFISCNNTTLKQISLTGWEPQTQQFASYGFGGGEMHLLTGRLENHNWTFTDGKTTLTMTRKSALEYQLHGTSPDGKTFDGSYSTKPE